MAIHSSSASFNAEQHLKFSEWQQAYNAAVLETDRRKLLERIQAAESAILKRLEAMSENSDKLAERRAIFDAMGTLQFSDSNPRRGCLLPVVRWREVVVL
jgi:hypothetical protein